MAAIHAADSAWEKAYNGGDVEGVVSLYDANAVLLPPGARIAMIEDIVSTGLSSRECVKAIQDAGGNVVCAAAIVDRSGGRSDPGVPFVALATLDVPAYPADALPPELAAIPVEDPGSRRLH